MSEYVGTLEEITTYPLTGARGVSRESALLGPGGLEGDRPFVLYETTDEGKVRVSQGQLPVLAQLTTTLDQEGSLHIRREPEFTGEDRTWSIVVPVLARTSLIEIIEFGDATPCHDMGSVAAAAISGIVGRNVRLARKTDEWMQGSGISPAERASATLHITSRETADSLAAAIPGGMRGDDRPTDRLRANLVISGFPALEDASWVGGVLVVGNAAIEADRHTIRCSVPGHDQRTGVNMKDLPKAYPHAVKAANGKPTIGVYGHLADPEPVFIRRGDPVRFVRGNS